MSTWECLGQNRKISLFALAFTFNFCYIYNLYFWLFQKSKPSCLFWAKIRQTFVKIFREICFLVWNNQSQCIWVVKYTNMSFTFEILANNIEISLQCLNKSLKQKTKQIKKKKKKSFSHLSFLPATGNKLGLYFRLTHQNKQHFQSKEIQNGWRRYSKMQKPEQYRSLLIQKWQNKTIQYKQF